ncbi:hypothetical protein [Mycoplasma struthionis]|uniref:YlbF family regulator n=1 Tax=Mycoplasma struthionis TaxID=538220 RepID=A0A502M1J2_9MOLU|nr:hypothetical protein [Mycoplasma struthionis]TPI01503.1 hypothetical protein FJM01_02545 [Mycoplasma struthionis]
MTIEQYLAFVKQAVGKNEKGLAMIKVAEADIKTLKEKNKQLEEILKSEDYKKQIEIASEVSKLFQKILKNLQDAAFAQ